MIIVVIVKKGITSDLKESCAEIARNILHIETLLQSNHCLQLAPHSTRVIPILVLFRIRRYLTQLTHRGQALQPQVVAQHHHRTILTIGSQTSRRRVVSSFSRIPDPSSLNLDSQFSLRTVPLLEVSPYPQGCAV